ncbi:MAG: hypothetical protein AAB393_15715, partial [Bacteroidota bacterium]
MKTHVRFLFITCLILPQSHLLTAREVLTRTTSAETTWTVQPSGTTANLYAVDAVSRNVAWAAGANGVVLRTTNEGAAWLDAHISGGDVVTVAGLDENNAIVGTVSASGSRIWKTTNAGLTWVARDSGRQYYNLQMVTSTVGYCAAGHVLGGELIKTTDGGDTWRSVLVPGAILDMFWYDTGRGWCLLSNNVVFRTTNGGATWQFSLTTLPAIFSLHFNSPQLGLVGSQTGSMNRSTDGGVTWTTGPAAIPGAVLSMTGVPGTQEFWAPANTNVYYTSNAGNNWTTSPPNGRIGLTSVADISMVTE